VLDLYLDKQLINDIFLAIFYKMNKVRENIIRPNTARQEKLSGGQYFSLRPMNMSKSRATKILLFKHYQTDAPI